MRTTDLLKMLQFVKITTKPRFPLKCLCREALPVQGGLSHSSFLTRRESHRSLLQPLCFSRFYSHILGQAAPVALRHGCSCPRRVHLGPCGSDLPGGGSQLPKGCPSPSASPCGGRKVRGVGQGSQEAGRPTPSSSFQAGVGPSSSSLCISKIHRDSGDEEKAWTRH